MTATEVLAALRARGAVVEADADGLRCKAPPGAIPAPLRQALLAAKGQVLALIRPTPPPGARLFFGDADGRPCDPGGEVYHWTWSGAPAWYYPPRHPVPPYALALRADHRLRCPSCHGRDMTLVRQVAADGRPQLKCKCARCHRHVRFVGKSDLWEVEYRAA